MPPDHGDLILKGDTDLAIAVKQLRGPGLISAMRTTGRAAMVPMVNAAKVIVMREATQSGALHDSLGPQVRMNKATGFLWVDIGPRWKFKRTTGRQRIRITGGKVSAIEDKPAIYGRNVEFGIGKNGAMRQKGPVHFLTRAYRSESGKTLPRLRDGMRKRIPKIIKKQGASNG